MLFDPGGAVGLALRRRAVGEIRGLLVGDDGDAVGHRLFDERAREVLRTALRGDAVELLLGGLAVRLDEVGKPLALAFGGPLLLYTGGGGLPLQDATVQAGGDCTSCSTRPASPSSR